MRIETHIKDVEVLTVPLFTDPKFKYVTKIVGGDFDSSCKKDNSPIVARFNHYRMCIELIIYKIKKHFTRKK